MGTDVTLRLHPSTRWSSEVPGPALERLVQVLLATQQHVNAAMLQQVGR